MRFRHRQTRRAMIHLLALTGAAADDPSTAQMAMIARSDDVPMFGDPVAENLTGLPARVFHGETAAAQVIVTYPNLGGIDPVVGISPSGAGRYPQLPSRRPPANTPVP